jgi:hypothetical protein
MFGFCPLTHTPNIPIPTPYLLHFPPFYPASGLPLPKGQAGTTLGTFTATNSSDFPLPRNDKCSASRYTPLTVLSLSLSLSHRLSSGLKGLIGLSFRAKYERLQFLLTTQEGAQMKVVLPHVNDFEKVGPEYFESTLIVN